MNTSILPRSDNTYDLGSVDYRWRDGYFSGFLDSNALKIDRLKILDTSYILRNVRWLHFDGVDDYVDIGDKSSLEGFDELTLIVAFKIFAYPTDTIYGYFLAGKEGVYKIDVNRLGQVRFLTGEDWGGSILYTPYRIDLNKMYVVAGVYDGTVKKLYVNGVQEDTKTTSGNVGTNTNTVSIGATPDYDAGYTYGNIYSVILYGRHLDDEEITQITNYIMSGEGEMITDGLVLWLDGDSIDIENGIWHDKSGNGNDGIIYGATYQSIFDELTASDIPWGSVNSSILPISDNVYDFGSSSSRWKDGYFSGTVYASTFSGNISWSNITGKPSCYTPCSHTHSRSDITDFWSEPFWDNIPDKPGTFPPSSHTHPISDLTDFVNVTKVIIDTSENKPDAGTKGRLFFETDTHIIYYDNGTNWVKLGVADWDDIVGKPSTFPPSAHTHDWDDITGKPSCYTPCSHTHDWSDITNIPSCFTPCSHTHDAGDITSGTLSSSRIPWGSVNSNLLPASDGEYSLGSSSYRWSVLYVANDANIGGNLNVGGATVVNSHQELMNVSAVSSNLIPGSDNAYDLGENSTPRRWRHIYAVTVNASTLSGSLDWSNITNKPSAYPPESHTHDASDITSGVFDTARIPDLDASKITSGTFSPSRIPWGSVNYNLLPSATDTYYLGTPANRWLSIAVKVIVADIFGTSIRPSSNAQYDIGTSTYKVRNLYAVTVHQGDAVFSNGWRISEGEKYGVDSPLVLVSPNGEVYRFELEKIK